MLGVCSATGEIDMASAPALGLQIYAYIDRSEEAVVSIDCSGVTFMDSAGYHVLVSATEYAARRGRTLIIRNLPRSSARVIQLCNFDDGLHLEPMLRRAPRTADAGTRSDQPVPMAN